MQVYARLPAADPAYRPPSAIPLLRPESRSSARAARSVAPPAMEATLGQTVCRAGRGLHTGQRSIVRLSPAHAGQGIVFRRWSEGSRTSTAAHWTRRLSRPLCTALSLPGGTIVRTVEHLMAAFSALGIDNATVDIDAEELPILDGSATPWCEAIGEAGRVELGRPRSVIEVLRTVEHREGERLVRIEPAPSFSMDVHIALACFGPMRWQGELTPGAFCSAIAPARSFGRLKWALPMKIYALVSGEPLLRGANLRSTAAIIGGRIVGGARLPDEPVRHRVLDLVGDLALAGAPILGHVTALHPGHEMNHALLARLMTTPDAWRMVGG